MKHFLTVGTILTLFGCNSYSDIYQSDPAATFKSTKSAKALAACIAHNMDSRSPGSIRPKIIDTGREPVEVEIINGLSHAGVAEVHTIKAGSEAAFRLPGISAVFPYTAIKQMTKNCG